MNSFDNIINFYLNLNENDSLVIFFDNNSSDIASSLIDSAIKNTDKVHSLNLDDLRPIKEFPVSITNLMNNATASMFIASSKEDELFRLRRPLRVLAHNKKIRHVHMPNLTKEIMKTGFNVDPKKLFKFSSKVYDFVKDSKKIKVTTKLGTDYIAIFKDHDWLDQNGNFREYDARQINLPGAEVLTCPFDSNGKVVVDGLLGDYFAQKYGVLKEIVTVEIKDNRIINISTKNKELEEDLKQYLRTDDNSDRIGEFALGTNIFLKELIGIMLQDEKFPGIHIAAGNPYPEKTKANWTSRTHVDMLILKPTIEVDGKLLMKEGKYLI